MTDRDPRIGDMVVAPIRGRLVGFDADLGKWTMQTDGHDHVPWTIELHWAQPFEPLDDARGS